MNYYPVIIVGGGPSGITCSYYLKQKNIDHLIIEKGEMLHTWKHERWDSFYLVTPNWMTNLPGLEREIPYNNEYMSKAEILSLLEKYLDHVKPKFIEHTIILEVMEDETRYRIHTSKGTFYTDQLIIATGMYSNPYIPSLAQKIPASVLQMHSSDYKNPCQLRNGNTLVVGSGWSGIQIALEIKRELGVEVFLSIGSMTPLPTLYRNVNGVYWLNRLSGYRNGREILSYKSDDFHNRNITEKMGQNLKQCQEEGIHLLGRLKEVDTERLVFEQSLHDAFNEASVYLEKVKRKIEDLIENEGMVVPDGDLDRFIHAIDHKKIKDISQLNLVNETISTIVWSTGFKRDYSWIKRPIFDDLGLPILSDGTSSNEKIYFCGLGLEVDAQLKSAFGVGLFAINESAERAVKALLDRM